MKTIAIERGHERYSLSSKVFEVIEDAILSGKLQPGDNLIEMKLSKELGVSRTPVREAIKQLELEGLVKIEPHKGAVVLGVSRKDIEDIYTIRTLIEGLAARWAAEKITEEEIERLKESVDLLEFYISKDNKQRLQKFDSDFHEIIYEACKSKPLKHTLSTFHHYIKRARAASFETPGRAKKALEEHKGILQAIIERDGDKAERLTCQHIKNAAANLLKSQE